MPRNSTRATYEEFLNSLTLQQVRVYSIVYEAAVERKILADISKVTGRDIGDYRNTIAVINTKAHKIFGEPLLAHQGKGKPYHPTSSGKVFYNLCLSLNSCFEAHRQEIERSHLWRPIRIAMPQLPLHDLFTIEDWVREEIKRRGLRNDYESELIHTRSESLPTVLLEQPDIDYAFGGLIDATSLDPSLAFHPIEQRHYNLISNFDIADEYGISDESPLTLELLESKKIPLVIANLGVIVDCLLKSMDIDRARNDDVERHLRTIGERYNIVRRTNDVHFLIELLCTSHRLCMFGTQDIFWRAEDRAKSKEVSKFWRDRNGKAPRIYYTTVRTTLPPLNVGIIRRQSASDRVHPDHPFALFWKAATSIDWKSHHQ
jgi:hypothetical protein